MPLTSNLQIDIFDV
jgi:hypothetical protein